MAYDKHTWTCDEPITVERLNHIEDGIANAGGGECGFECEEDVTLLTEETVTTTAQGEYNDAQLSYSQFIDAETIRVTFDGVEYDCPRIILSSSQNFYGGFNLATETPDFSQYPFAISSYSGSESIGGRGNTRDVDTPHNYIISQTAGTHTVKIEIVEETITTTPCFDKARGYSCDEEIVTLAEESVTTEFESDAGYGTLSYSQLINQDTITVTFNGTEYECDATIEEDGGYFYGASYDVNLDAWDWSEYPFQISSYETPFGIENNLATQTAGTYTIKIESEQTIVTTTPCFDLARGYSCGEAVLTEETLTAIEV